MSRRRRISNSKIQRTKLNRSRARCKAIRSSCSSWTSQESDDFSLAAEGAGDGNSFQQQQQQHYSQEQRDTSFLLDEQSTVSLPDSEQQSYFSYTSFEEAFGGEDGLAASNVEYVDRTETITTSEPDIPRTSNTTPIANESVIDINVFHNMDYSINCFDQHRTSQPLDMESYTTPEVDELLLSDDWLITDADLNDYFTGGVFDFI